VVRKLSWPKEHYGYKIGSESEVSKVWMNLKMTMQIWELKMVTVRATVVGWDVEWNAVLAGDPKKIRLLCNTTLITDIPSRGSKEERIRIHLQVWTNIRNNGYKR